jgi:hypothetical protein
VIRSYLTGLRITTLSGALLLVPPHPDGITWAMYALLVNQLAGLLKAHLDRVADLRANKQRHDFYRQDREEAALTVDRQAQARADHFDRILTEATTDIAQPANEGKKKA